MTTNQTSRRQTARGRRPHSAEWREQAGRMIAYPEDYGWTRREASRLADELICPPVEVWELGWRGTPAAIGAVAAGFSAGVLLFPAAAAVLGVAAVILWVAALASLGSVYRLEVDAARGRFVATAVTGETMFTRAQVRELVRREYPGGLLLHDFEIVYDGGSVSVRGEAEAEERFRVIQALAAHAPIRHKVYDPDPD